MPILDILWVCQKLLMKGCQELQNEGNKVRPRKKNYLRILKATCLIHCCQCLESQTRHTLRNFLSWQQHHTPLGNFFQEKLWGGMCGPPQCSGFAESIPKERIKIPSVPTQDFKHREYLNPAWTAKSTQLNSAQPNHWESSTGTPAL